MSTYINGIGKVFVVQNKLGSMYFDGFKSERDLVAHLLFRAGKITHTEQIAWIEKVCAEVKAQLQAEMQPLRPCASNRDGGCTHPDCPQLCMGVPRTRGDQCPLNCDEGAA